MTLGSRLKKTRLELGLTQVEVAKRIFVSPQTISRWELDQSLPSISYVLEISTIYNVSLDYLLKEDESVGKAYKNKDRMMKLLAGVLIIFYVVLFAYLLADRFNNNLRTMPLDKIEMVSTPEKLTNKTNISFKLDKRNIEGVDSQFSNGNLYIAVLYKPITLFNATDQVELSLKDLANSNNVSIDKINSIYLVQSSQEKYDKSSALKDETQKKLIYTKRE